MTRRRSRRQNGGSTTPRSSRSSRKKPKRNLDLQITIENDQHKKDESPPSAAGAAAGTSNGSSSDKQRHHTRHDDVISDYENRTVLESKRRKAAKSPSPHPSHHQSSADERALVDVDVLDDEIDLNIGDEFDVRSEASIDKPEVASKAVDDVTMVDGADSGQVVDTANNCNKTNDENSDEEEDFCEVLDVFGISSATADVSTRAISPIVFDRQEGGDTAISSSSEDENEDNVIVRDEVQEPAPPGVEDEDEGEKKAVLIPAEIKAQKGQRHMMLLKYMFKESHFYLIKSNNHDNVKLAKSRSVWSTPPNNEAKLNKSFSESRNVILVFSVRESGHFQGFARLRTESRHDLPPVQWVLPGSMRASALGGVFQIDWLCQNDLAFSKCCEIRNSFNSNKPVKIGRDGQEIEPNAGKHLCMQFSPDEMVDLEKIIKETRKLQESNPPKFVPPQPTPDFYQRDKRLQQQRRYSADHFNHRGRGPIRIGRGGPPINDQRYGMNRSRPYGRPMMRNFMGNTTNMHHDGYQPSLGNNMSPATTPYFFPSPQIASTVAIATNSPPQPKTPRLSSRVTKATSASNSARRYDHHQHDDHGASDEDMSPHQSSRHQRSYRDEQSHADACDDFLRRLNSSGSISYSKSTPTAVSSSSSSRHHRRHHHDSRSPSSSPPSSPRQRHSSSNRNSGRHQRQQQQQRHRSYERSRSRDRRDVSYDRDDDVDDDSSLGDMYSDGSDHHHRSITRPQHSSRHHHTSGGSRSGGGYYHRSSHHHDVNSPSPSRHHRSASCVRRGEISSSAGGGGYDVRYADDYDHRKPQRHHHHYTPSSSRR